jgi:hypothetical protein
VRYLVGSVLFLLALVASVRSASAQAGEEGETPEPNLEEPVSSPAPESEVPDIDALSERSIEHYEIQYGKPRMESSHRVPTAFSFSWGALLPRNASTCCSTCSPELRALRGRK